MHLMAVGSVDPVEAWSELGVYRLSSVIHKLRKAGFSIETKRKQAVNKFGEKCSFAQYVLRGNYD